MARRASALLVILAMLFSIAALTTPARAATAVKPNPTVKLVINGQVVTPDVPAQLINDRTMVPARIVFESIGAEVGWDDPTRTVTVKYIEHSVSVTIGSKTATVDGSPVTLDVAPVIIGNRTLVPLRFIAEAVGAKVGWIQSPRTATVDISPTVLGVSWEAGTGHGTLRIEAVGTIKATARSLTGPDRIVVDIPGALLSLSDSGINLDKDRNVTDISSMADTEGVHITLTLSGPAAYTLVQSGSTADLEVGYRVTGITFGQSDGKDTVNIATSGPVAYHLMHLTNPNRLVLDFDLATMTQPLDASVDGSYLSSVRAAQFSSDPAVARVVLEFRGDAVPVNIQRTDDGLTLTASPEYIAALAGRTIYIDPGHGGTDPGALGVSGTHEDDVNLDSALRLWTLLKNAGANAVLTRDGDYNVALYDRPAMANEAGADLFVSMHNNWSTSSTANGTEVYYYFNNPDSPRLAAAVHDALNSELGLKDRGVQTANFAVLRETTMPSILVETAFLSNANEDSLLNSPDFRQKDAQAIYDGILAYFITHGGE